MKNGKDRIGNPQRKKDVKERNGQYYEKKEGNTAIHIEQEWRRSNKMKWK